MVKTLYLLLTYMEVEKQDMRKLQKKQLDFTNSLSIMQSGLVINTTGWERYVSQVSQIQRRK